jgi:hypothetical protein
MTDGNSHISAALFTDHEGYNIQYNKNQQPTTNNIDRTVGF